MNTKKCLKCGHAASYETEPPQACPSCGAIYTKVEAAQALSASGPTSKIQDTASGYFASQRNSKPRRSSAEIEVHSFAERMREQTLYPAWRKVVGFFAILGYIVAAVLAVSVFFSANGSTWVLLVGWGIAALVALVAKVGKELSLMLADLSDAAVHLAAGRDPGQ